MNRLTTRLPVTKKTPPPSRFARLLDFVIRHGGAVAVDHTPLPPLDRIAGHTGLYRPARPGRRC